MDHAPAAAPLPSVSTPPVTSTAQVVAGGPPRLPVVRPSGAAGDTLAWKTRVPQQLSKSDLNWGKVLHITQAQGWKTVIPEDERACLTFFTPGSSVDNGVEGEDYFTGQDALMQYLVKAKGQCARKVLEEYFEKYPISTRPEFDSAHLFSRSETKPVLITDTSSEGTLESSEQSVATPKSHISGSSSAFGTPQSVARPVFINRLKSTAGGSAAFEDTVEQRHHAGGGREPNIVEKTTAGFDGSSNSKQCRVESENKSSQDSILDPNSSTKLANQDPNRTACNDVAFHKSSTAEHRDHVNNGHNQINGTEESRGRARERSNSTVRQRERRSNSRGKSADSCGAAAIKDMEDRLYNFAWGILKGEEKWRHQSGNNLHSFSFLPPTLDQKSSGVAGKDYFVGEQELARYVQEQRPDIMERFHAFEASDTSDQSEPNETSDDSGATSDKDEVGSKGSNSGDEGPKDDTDSPYFYTFVWKYLRNKENWRYCTGNLLHTYIYVKGKKKEAVEGKTLFYGEKALVDYVRKERLDIVEMYRAHVIENEKETAHKAKKAKLLQRKLRNRRKRKQKLEQIVRQLSPEEHRKREEVALRSIWLILRKEYGFKFVRATGLQEFWYLYPDVSPKTAVEGFTKFAEEADLVQSFLKRHNVTAHEMHEGVRPEYMPFTSEEAAHFVRNRTVDQEEDMPIGKKVGMRRNNANTQVEGTRRAPDTNQRAGRKRRRSTQVSPSPESRLGSTPKRGKGNKFSTTPKANKKKGKANSFSHFGDLASSQEDHVQRLKNAWPILKRSYGYTAKSTTRLDASWVYLAPGVTAPKHGVLGETMFLSEQDVMKHFLNTSGQSLAEFERKHGLTDNSSVESSEAENESTISSAAAAPSRSRDEVGSLSEESDDETNPMYLDRLRMQWPTLRKQLGYTFKPSSNLQYDWVYLAPGVSKNSGVLGKTMFVSECEAVKHYLRTHGVTLEDLERKGRKYESRDHSNAYAESIGGGDSSDDEATQDEMEYEEDEGDDEEEDDEGSTDYLQRLRLQWPKLRKNFGYSHKKSNSLAHPWVFLAPGTKVVKHGVVGETLFHSEEEAVKHYLRSSGVTLRELERGINRSGPTQVLEEVQSVSDNSSIGSPMIVGTDDESGFSSDSDSDSDDERQEFETLWGKLRAEGWAWEKRPGNEGILAVNYIMPGPPSRVFKSKQEVIRFVKYGDRCASPTRKKVPKASGDLPSPLAVRWDAMEEAGWKQVCVEGKTLYLSPTAAGWPQNKWSVDFLNVFDDLKAAKFLFGQSVRASDQEPNLFDEAQISGKEHDQQVGQVNEESAEERAARELAELEADMERVDKLSCALERKWIGRSKEIQSLISLIGTKMQQPSHILVHGDTATGKSSILQDMMAQSGLDFAFVQSDLCYAPYLVFDSILQVLPRNNSESLGSDTESENEDDEDDDEETEVKEDAELVTGMDVDVGTDIDKGSRNDLPDLSNGPTESTQSYESRREQNIQENSSLLHELFGKPNAARSPGYTAPRVKDEIGPENPAEEDPVSVAAPMKAFRARRRCDQVHNFSLELRRRLSLRRNKQNDTFYIVLDDADRLFSSMPWLLSGLLQLHEVVGERVCVILSCQMASSQLEQVIRAFNVCTVFFPAYSELHACQIIAQNLQKSRDVAVSEQTIKRVAQYVVDVFYKQVRDVREMAYIAQEYLDALVEQLGPSQDPEAMKQSELLAFFQPRSQVTMNTIFRHPVEQHFNPTTTAADEKKRLLESTEIPYNTRVLLMAGYLASYNSVEQDRKLFSTDRIFSNRAKVSKGQRKGGGANKFAGEGPPRQVLLGPRKFHVERLVWIYHALLASLLGPETAAQSFAEDMFKHLRTLESTGMLTRVSSGDDLNKVILKCVAPHEYVHAVAASIADLNLNDYLEH